MSDRLYDYMNRDDLAGATAAPGTPTAPGNPFARFDNPFAQRAKTNPMAWNTLVAPAKNKKEQETNDAMTAGQGVLQTLAMLFGGG